MLDRLDGWELAVFGIAGWTLLWLGVSAIGGWGRLARAYPDRGDLAGRRWWFQSARLRFGLAYNNCLVVDADATTLRLAVLLPFRIGHAPIHLPWSDLGISRRRLWWVRVVELEPRRVPSMKITISERLFSRIEEAVGSIPVEASSS